MAPTRAATDPSENNPYILFRSKRSGGSGLARLPGQREACERYGDIARRTLAPFCAGVERASPARVDLQPNEIGEVSMNGVIYLVGLVVVVLAILSFFGLR